MVLRRPNALNPFAVDLLLLRLCVTMCNHDTFDVSLVVKKDNLEASGDSIMGLLMLAASKGTEIELIASGLEAAETLTALSDLITNLFGEEM